MEIGTNEQEFYDDFDDFDESEVNQESEQQNEETHEELNKNSNESEDFIDSLLKSKGIEDKTKIKFENEEGSIDEVDWDTLSNEDKLNIIQSSDTVQKPSFLDSEIELINAIRQSGMSPSEYLNYIGSDSVNRYIQNTQTPQYTVDQYNDDELFLADFMTRMQDVTEEEAQEALAQAKSNETLFQKQINAIRNEYKTIENENLQQSQIEQEQQQQLQYQEFTDNVVNEINNFTNISEYGIELADEDKQELYDFITGADAAGNNYFAKAMADPKTLVETAWFALNGKQMINDLTDYFKKEITQVRKESYEKGKQDASKKQNSQVVYKKKEVTDTNMFDDLDDF